MNIRGSTLVVGAALLLAALPGAAAGEAERWQALSAAVPALPTTPVEAAKKVSARPVQSEGLGITQLRFEVADVGLRALQQQVDQLFEPTSKASAVQIRRNLDAANKDPVLIELARKIDKTWQPNPANPAQMPSPAELRKLDREIERVLGPMPTPASAARSPRTDIAAYRLELQRATPRSASFLQQIAGQQRQFAQQHAQLDRDAIARLAGADAAMVARTLVEQHHMLAQQQLDQASVVLRAAREALAPRVKHLADLARAAELRNAPPGERNEAYAPLKAYVESVVSQRPQSSRW